MVDEEWQVLASTTNKGGYTLDLVARHDFTGERNSAFSLGIEGPDLDGPIDFVPSRQDFLEFGLLLLGLASFTEQNLHVTYANISSVKKQLYRVLWSLGVDMASEIASLGISYHGKHVKYGASVKPIKGMLKKQGRRITRLPSDVPMVELELEQGSE